MTDIKEHIKNHIE
jgi:hypothetical protein